MSSTTSSSSTWATLNKPEALLSSCDDVRNNENNDDARSEFEGWTIQNSNTPQQQQTRGFLIHVPSSITCPQNIDGTATAANNDKYPILLAFHGFTGRPQQEIAKWKHVAEQLQFIIVAPQGTSSGAAGDVNFGWNAIDCCGYPAEHEVDDVSFVHAIMDIIREEMPLADASNVVATGFSNGGFLVSLLGLQPQRPDWLKGIVPTGGYQYNTSLYDGGLVDPLPVFAHHGGSDAIVRPSGCCRPPAINQTTTAATSNCPLDIGAKQDTCLSTDDAFHLWANNINDCTDTQTQVTEEGAVCSTGLNCRNDVVTKLCTWPEAQHSWGNNMPGTETVGNFLSSVFTMGATPAVATATPTVPATVAPTLGNDGETFFPGSSNDITSGGYRSTDGSSTSFMTVLSVALLVTSIFAAGKLRVPSFCFEKRTRSFQPNKMKRNKGETASVEDKEEMVELIESNSLSRHDLVAPNIIFPSWNN